MLLCRYVRPKACRRARGGIATLRVATPSNRPIGLFGVDTSAQGVTMQRLVGALSAVALIALGAVASVAAYAPPAIPSSVVARFDQGRFLGGTGAAISRVDLLAVGGQVSTRLEGRPPGERWELMLYDAGTCDDVQHIVLTLPVLVIGSDGHRFQSVALTASSRGAIIRAQTERARLVLRLSSGSYHTCRRYFPVPLPVALRWASSSRWVAALRARDGSRRPPLTLSLRSNEMLGLSRPLDRTFRAARPSIG